MPGEGWQHVATAGTAWGGGLGAVRSGRGVPAGAITVIRCTRTAVNFTLKAAALLARPRPGPRSACAI